MRQHHGEIKMRWDSIGKMKVSSGGREKEKATKGINVPLKVVTLPSVVVQPAVTLLPPRPRYGLPYGQSFT